jgi:flagellar biosynthesis protein FliQ
MKSDYALQLMADMLWNTALVAAPILLMALVVGLIISILQVVTQIQEVSLTFVPKLIAAVGAMVLFGPWMLKRLTLYSTNLITNIPNQF